MARHKVRVGENLKAIAKQYGLSKAKLAKLNEMSPRSKVEPGAFLVVPARGKTGPPGGETVTTVVPAKHFVYRDRRRVFYRAVSGDTLERLAAAFEVTTDEIVRWNDLDPSATLQPEMVLQIFVSVRFNGWSKVTHIPEAQVRLFVAGSTELYEDMARRQDRQRIIYHTKRGDTLKRLARRHDTSEGSIARINHFSRSHDLEPGEEVVLYVQPRKAQKAQKRQKSGSGSRAPAPKSRPKKGR